MARIISFSVFRGATYANTSNYYSEEGRIRSDLPASELPEDEPKISRRAKHRRASHAALSGFASARIGEPMTPQSENESTPFSGGADLT